ncbi:MAG: membrane protein insertion efficiency factor YidD [Candidatus Omnitrophica bacterium]|nr:membrane protein insertion efficiency factor YidD [Candidatus Omnitrophota bacterium]
MRIIAIFCITIYRNLLSMLKLRQSCRFYPSCSQYAISALTKYGFFKGFFLSISRILKCHPFSPGGYDPIK